MRREARTPVGRRVATFVAIAVIHFALIVYVAFTRAPGLRATEDSFVTHVFFLTEAEPSAEVRAAPSSTPGARRASPPVLSAPITLPPEPPTPETPSASPRIDWAREAELSASRQLQNDDEARRLAAPFTHDFGAQGPVRAAPQFRWDHAHTNRIEPLETGGMLIWLNERCAVAVAGAVFPVCMIGKISARGDLFEHMKDAPVLGEAPRPP